MAEQERQKTTHLELIKPRYDEDADIKDINDNMDIIDAAFVDMEEVVAPAFVQATANAAETYVMYDGDVYYLPNGHEANVTWANTTKTLTNIGEQLKLIKQNAGAQIDDTAGSGVTNKVWSANKIVSALSDLLKIVAPAFAQATANDAGAYVVYENELYYLPDGHTSGTTWVNTTKTKKDIGEVLMYLKENAGAQIDDLAGAGDYDAVWSADKTTGELTRLLSVVAPPFVKATANAEGSYVTYEGELYYLPDGHTANTTWASTTKTKKSIGEVLAYLKENAGAQIDDTAGIGDDDVVWSADKVAETIEYYTTIVDINFGTVSSLPATVYDDRIVSTMRVDHCDVGNPDVFETDPTLTIEDGVVTLSGEMTNGTSTSLIVYLAHNPLIAESPVVIDTTLLIRGAAADAQAVGTAVNQKLNKPATNGTNGQVLHTNGSGGTYWDDEASQSYIVDAVEDWLDTNMPAGETVAVDTTMSVSGAAADAKKTGELLSQKAPAIIDNDTGYSHTNVDLFVMNGNANAFGNARYANRKNLIVGYNRNLTYSDMHVDSYDNIVVINGTSASSNDIPIWVDSTVDIPAGSYIFKIEPYVGNSTMTGGKNMYLDFWYDGNTSSTYDKRVTISSVKDAVKSATIELTDHAYKIRVYVGYLGTNYNTYDGYRLFLSLFPSDVTIVDTGETISPSGTLEIIPATSMPVLDTMMHKSSVYTVVDTKTYVDNHTQEIDYVYFRPEDFGAVGNGVADDSVALQACINAAQTYAENVGKAIRGYGTYKISTGIVFSCRELDVYLHKIIYTGEDAAVTISGSFSKFAFQSIRAFAGQNAVCIRCVQSANTGYKTTFYHNIVECLWMRSKGNNIELVRGENVTLDTIMYNRFYFQSQWSENANIIYVATKVCNENDFSGKFVTAPNGYLVCFGTLDENTRGSGVIRLYNYCLESSLKNGTNGFVIYNNCRFAEMQNEQTIEDRTSGFIYKWEGVCPRGRVFDSTGGIDLTSVSVEDALSWEECLQKVKYLFEHGDYDIDQPFVAVIPSAGTADRFATIRPIERIANANLRESGGMNNSITGTMIVYYKNIAFKPDYEVYHKVDNDMTIILTDENNWQYITPTIFDIDASSVTIRLDASYCCIAIDKFDVIQHEGKTAIVYDKLGNIIFDGTNLGAGVYHFKCSFVEYEYGDVAVTLENETVKKCPKGLLAGLYSGYNERWSVVSYGARPSNDQVTTAVNAYLGANFSNPSNPPLDRSLESGLSAAPADIVGDLKTDVSILEDGLEEAQNALGLIGSLTDYGTTHPLIINDVTGTYVDLEFSTAASFLQAGKNLYPNSIDSFTRTKTVMLPMTYPAGTYVFSAYVTSTDTDKTFCWVGFSNGTNYVTPYTQGIMYRDQRTECVMTPSGAFDRIVLFASDDYGHSASDDAVFSNIQLEWGSEPSNYIPYNGFVRSVTDRIVLTHDYTILISNDGSDIHGSSRNGSTDPVIPHIQDALSVLSPNATNSDVGKFLKVKTVSNGKAASYEFGSLTEIDDTAGSGDTNKTWSADKLHDLKSDIQDLKEEVGLAGQSINYGTDNPLIINDALGVVVDLEFTTAESYLISNRNLIDAGTKTFTRTKVCQLPMELPAGTYTFSAGIQSNDTDSTKCQVNFQKDGVSVGYKNIDRGERISAVITATGPFTNVVLTSSDTYGHADGDTATFTDMQLEWGEIPTEYIAYDGDVNSVSGNDSITLEYSPTYIFTDDASDVHGSSTDGNIHPVIPDIQETLEKLQPLKGKKIAVFGDSIWGNDRIEGVANFLAEYSGATVYNGAVGGSRITGDRSQYESPAYRPFDGVNLIHALLTSTWTDQDAQASSVISYVETETLPMLKALDMSTVDIVILAYGSNDFTAPRTKAQIQTAYNTAISELLTSYPRLRIVVLTPAWRMFDSGETDGDVYENSNNDTIKDVCDAIIENAKAHHITAVNMFEELPWRAETVAYYLDSDLVHPNKNGNMVYAHIVYGKLRSMY